MQDMLKELEAFLRECQIELRPNGEGGVKVFYEHPTGAVIHFPQEDYINFWTQYGVGFDRNICSKTMIYIRSVLND